MRRIIIALGFAGGIAACAADDVGPSTFSDGGSDQGFTCTNGCQQGGRCLIDDDTACGVSCTLCSGLQRCSAGQCLDPAPNCGAECSCCTAAGDCIKTPTNENCGFASQQCTPCTGDNICDTTKKQCAPPPEKLALSFASLTPSGNCGALDDCDAYVEISDGTTIIRATPPIDNIKKGSKATYDALILLANAADIEGKTFGVKITDIDPGGSHDTAADCQVTIDKAQLATGTISSACGGGEAQIGEVVFSAQSVKLSGKYLLRVDSWSGYNCASSKCNVFVDVTVNGQANARTRVHWDLNATTKGDLSADALLITDESALLGGIKLGIYIYLIGAGGGEVKRTECDVKPTAQEIAAGSMTIPLCGVATKDVKLTFEKL